MVAGAESAGGVAAYRVSEDSEASVLVSEADDSNLHPYIQIPLGVGPIRPQH
jgi:choline dehydrogenase-like flavoprotein